MPPPFAASQTFSLHRSSIQRAENVNGGPLAVYSKNELDEEIDYDECLSCQ